MTELQEVAEAIKLKHGQLWPLTREMAAYIANHEASDQGHTIVANLVHELMMLNPVFRKEEPDHKADGDNGNLIIKLRHTLTTLKGFATGGFDVEYEIQSVKEARNLLDLLQRQLDGKEWRVADLEVIADYLRNHGIQVRDFEDETGLTSDQLREKYAKADGGWGQHPRFERRDWRSEVASETTQRGYWGWVVAQIEQEAND